MGVQFNLMYQADGKNKEIGTFSNGWLQDGSHGDITEMVLAFLARTTTDAGVQKMLLANAPLLSRTQTSMKSSVRGSSVG